MLVAMTKVQIVGRKRQVEPILGRLYGMGLLELGSALEEPALELAPYPGEDDRAARGQEQRLLLAQLDGLLTLAGDSAATIPAAEAASSDDLSRELKTLMPLVEPLAARIEDLRTEFGRPAALHRASSASAPTRPRARRTRRKRDPGPPAPGGRARPQYRRRDDRRCPARGSADRPRRSLRARGGSRRLRRDRLRARDSTRAHPRGYKPSSAVSASVPFPCPLVTRISLSGAQSQPWRAGFARFRPSSTGRRRSCVPCWRRGCRHGEQRASDSWATSNSSKPWRRPGRRVARS